MERQFKHIALDQFELKEDGDRRVIEGYASTFGNVDSDNDIVLPGAFKESIASRMPAMFYQHKSDRIPGIWTFAAEDSKGLYVKGEFINTTLGRDVYEETKSGAIRQMSIGYGVKKASYDKAKSVRSLEQVKLYEVSLVTFPANEQAIITRVKGQDMTEREFENFLRDEGKFSHEAAKTIVARGFKALSGQRDAEDQELATLTNLFTQFTI
jgi:HK97 family phage prohead protease